MLVLILTVTDQEKFDCCSTEVSSAISDLNLHSGTGKGGSLQKTQFARITNGTLVYKEGESDSTVYTGLYNMK